MEKLGNNNTHRDSMLLSPPLQQQQQQHQQHKSLKSRRTNKPVVVLAGWLGCQPRNLNRYRDMYDQLGWTTVIRIGSPRSVLNAMTMGPSSSSSSSSGQKTIIQSSSEMLSSLTISLLRELQSLQPPYFAIHIFSNNGCFLWEWIRYLLFDKDGQSSSSVSCLDLTNVDIHNLRRKLIGVIFDSAPVCYNGNIDGLRSALRYIPSKEKDQLLQVASTLNIHLVQHRFDKFWSGLCNDPTDISHLYMYSQSDELASAEEIERLIQYRLDLKGRSNVWKHNFTDSEHCGHILKYPEVYHDQVKQFLDFCTNQRLCEVSHNIKLGRRQSRL